MARISPRASECLFRRDAETDTLESGPNETLLLVTCAERLLSGEIEFARSEIASRIGQQLPAQPDGLERAPFLQWRYYPVFDSNTFHARAAVDFADDCLEIAATAG